MILSSEIFAIVPVNVIDNLLAHYRRDLQRIDHVASVMADPESGTVIPYFFKGNKKNTQDNWYGIDSLFNLSGAVAALNANYWQRALDLTDVYESMPQGRRNDWYKQISTMDTPPFTYEAVHSTLGSLLSMRGQFLGERVCGLFRNLSGDHVTNQPQGFGKRMILAFMTDKYGYPNTQRCGYIDDLRAVIAKFMGRDSPKHSQSAISVSIAREKSGEWITLDGGALRLRVYIKGTAHLEVHPDIAWRLNMILASIYPSAIPASSRTKPKQTPKDFVLFGRPLPFAVIYPLSNMEEVFCVEKNVRTKITNALRLKYPSHVTKEVLSEVDNVIAALGGVKENGYYLFDYDAREVIKEVVCSGCIPDQKSHQFYPTPPTLAQTVIDIAKISPDTLCLEPSAGIGSLADLVPSTNLQCIEVSSIHCAVLRSKGHCVENMDFLSYNVGGYERIVMNPPFSDGRWSLHLIHAASLLADGGRLVAVLPASAKNKDLLGDGFVCEFHGTYDNMFDGTSVSVVIVSVSKK